MANQTLTKVSHFTERVMHRAQRVAADLPSARLSSELALRQRRDAFRGRLAGESVDDSIVQSMQRTGIALTDAHTLGLDEVMAAAQPLADELLALQTPPTLPTTHLSPERLATAPEIFRWGASDRILDLLERYFEVPVAYHGVYLRRDIPIPREVSSNTWHLDMEDRNVVKIVVYLSDVGDGDGAFTHISAEDTTKLTQALGTRYKMGDDAMMRRLVPEERWHTVTGNAGTVLLSDTARVFHKGKRPRVKDRIALFYDYTSQQPTHGFYCKSAAPRPLLEELTEGMSQRAKDAVFWRPKLTAFDPAKHEAG